MIIGEFCDVFPPELDGVGMVVRNYVEQLDKGDNSCYYVAPRPKRGVEASINSLNYASLPIPNEAYRLGLPFVDLNYILEVSQIRFDLIHAHSPFTAGLEALRLSKVRKIPIVASFHSKYYDNFYSKTRSKVLSKEGVDIVVNFYNRCDEVWTVNESSAEVLRSYGYKKDIIVMPNGTDLLLPTKEDCDRIEAQYHLGDGEVFLFVGQQNLKKNIKHILEAISVYSKKHTNFKMVFVGQGPDSDKISHIAAELNIEKYLVFTGQIFDRGILLALFKRADLLVFPSLYDTCGLVVREAAAAGTPSLLIKGSCAAEGIIHNENGFLCEDTPESIASCMENALPRTEAVGACAQKTIPLSWSEVAKKVIDRYRSLIEG